MNSLALDGEGSQADGDHGNCLHPASNIFNDYRISVFDSLSLASSGLIST